MCARQQGKHRGNLLDLSLHSSLANWFTNTIFEIEIEKWKSVTKLCPTLRNPLECSPPGSSVYGISQARTLEWVAISFSSILYYMILVFLFLTYSLCNSLQVHPSR